MAVHNLLEALKQSVAQTQQTGNGSIDGAHKKKASKVLAASNGRSKKEPAGVPRPPICHSGLLVWPIEIAVNSLILWKMSRRLLIGSC